MALTAEQVATTAAFVDQFAAQADQLRQRLINALALIWSGFDAWYTDRLIDELARQTVDLLQTDADFMRGLAQQYASVVLGELLESPAEVAPVSPEPLRGGVDLVGVYRRPAEQYRHRVATGTDPDEAERMALHRRDVMAAYDLTLAGRDAQIAQYDANDQITGYRRIVHPELARTGSCGLCIVASDRIYQSSELMPLHNGCNCTTSPVRGEDDPGGIINSSELVRFYREAGSKKAEDLRQTRYRVREHGELGPTLVFQGDHFRGPGQVKPLEDDPERARKMLADARPVLQLMVDQGYRADAIDYQRGFIDRLENIAA